MGKDQIYTLQDLRDMQAWPLERKIQVTQTRLLEWIIKTKKQCAVSFSGGKDSTVLLDLARQVEPDIPAIFANTGLEFPEVREFALSKPNVVAVYPKKTFLQVLREYGYPLISKEVSLRIYTARKGGPTSKHSRDKLLGLATYTRSDGSQMESFYNCEKWAPLAQLPIKFSQECCKITKEKPIAEYQKQHKLKPIVGTMASESMRRQQGWLKSGCNAFDGSHPRSAPLSFWTEQDVLNYIRSYDVEIPSVYGQIVPESSGSVKAKNGICLKCTGRQRTGCIFCGYGAHLEAKDLGSTRFQQLAFTHPKLYDYCMRGGEWIDNPEYDPAMPVYDPDYPEWTNWNPKKIWVPNTKGLGYKVMLDIVNSVYGKNFIAYD